jgi:citrate lyase subunit beta/citryl-CoA lyase
MIEGRLRRSMLMTPGNRLDRLRKAGAVGADAVVFDLEDSVPPAAKAEARAVVTQALRERPRDVARTGREVCVRINSLSSGFGADDLAALPLGLIDSIMLPKVESAADVADVERLLQVGGGADALEFIATIETPRGLFNALAIADASRRTTALFFGSGDYSSATGAAVSDNSLLFPRSVIAAAAGAAQIQAIDAAYFQDVRDADATRRDALRARELGFAGKVVFHPVQVAACNETFSPTAAEIVHAQRLVAAYRDSVARGHGTTLADGVFVAIDLVAPAERLLRRAALLGLSPRPE